MRYTGSCHCGQITFAVAGELTQVMECNCSHCSRKGYLLWFVDQDQMQRTTPDAPLATYTFNKHVTHIPHFNCHSKLLRLKPLHSKVFKILGSLELLTVFYQ